MENVCRHRAEALPDSTGAPNPHWIVKLLQAGTCCLGVQRAITCYDSYEDMWNRNERGDWMLLILGRVIGQQTHDD